MAVSVVTVSSTVPVDEVVLERDMRPGTVPTFVLYEPSIKTIETEENPPHHRFMNLLPKYYPPFSLLKEVGLSYSEKYYMSQ